MKNIYTNGQNKMNDLFIPKTHLTDELGCVVGYAPGLIR